MQSKCPIFAFGTNGTCGTCLLALIIYFIICLFSEELINDKYENLTSKILEVTETQKGETWNNLRIVYTEEMYRYGEIYEYDIYIFSISIYILCLHNHIYRIFPSFNLSSFHYFRNLTCFISYVSFINSLLNKNQCIFIVQ